MRLPKSQQQGRHPRTGVGRKKELVQQLEEASLLGLQFVGWRCVERQASGQLRYAIDQASETFERPVGLEIGQEKLDPGSFLVFEAAQPIGVSCERTVIRSSGGAKSSTQA